MTVTFTLAHLSDLHLGPLPRFAVRHWNVKRVLGYLNWQRGRRHVHRREVADLLVADLLSRHVDHVAVTGDLVNIALPGEYEAALEWLAALGTPERVSVVPGNHDIYTRLRHDPGVARWAAYMCGDGPAGAAGAGAWRAEGAFPYVRRRAGVALVGVNSAVPTPPFVAAGRVGETQLRNLARTLAGLGREGLCRVVLIHHPPLPGQAPRLRALTDAQALADVIAEAGAELILHGHNHRDMLDWLDRGRGRIPVLGIASGSAARLHHGEPLARYHLIAFTPRGPDMHIAVRRLGLGTVGAGVEELTFVDLEVRRPQAARH